MAHHQLKILPSHMNAAMDGTKRFEIRDNTRDIVCKYLADHPENRQKDAAGGLAQAALYDAWPCK
ncbi:hypothetical protein B5K05_09775 [Rhizobium phaseoli]|uniref:Rap1a/Tai family immunity protein n=1 Tax=Rhizobium phaseoli TaxID=396 RepID=UPI000E2D4B8C|nr:Rap1a/Tai family immunity protein [Rhizobium phaseoli]RDJ13290.1 hypothetical protein B5K04_09745 [Rhizobium phaseoli]RDJ16432.1 hypothetical protein B5K05_09775 [Rhizobium phaseoli]